MRHAVRILFSVLLLVLGLNFAVTAQAVKPFVTVDAARYQPAVAPDSIVAGFSAQLTTQEAWATEDVDSLTPGIQLPTSLAGLRVLVNNRLAQLLYAGPNQINYIVPTDTELDATATVVVTDAQGSTVAQGELAMAASSLNIFTSNQQGTGSPAAAFTADGNTYTSVNNPDGSTNVVPPGNYLILFGTGVRAGRDIKAFIGGLEAQVDYAGEQPQYVALDQINVKIPDALTGQGVLDVTITDGLTVSNVVTIDVGGNPQVPSGAPVITGFSAPEAYAGQVLTITGSQFPTSLAEASVKLGSTLGQIVSTSATSMSFIVPYGAATNKIALGNAAGVRKSTATLAIKTSISGTILDGQGAPVVGLSVNVINAGIGATTDSVGRFLLTDVPRGIAQVEVDTSSFPANLGLPTITYCLVVSEGADNEIGYPIYLPANLGASVILNSVSTPAGLKAAIEAGAPVVLENDGLRLEIPGTVTFPKGAKDTTIKLTRLGADGRLPAPLPSGIYPSVVGMITPMGAGFGDKTSGMATLSFPNPDNFPAGATLDLYAFRPNVAPSGFVKKGTATVDAQGQKIVAAGLIDLATIWFVGLPSDQVTFTNVSGTVLDGSNKPVNKARVFVRGRGAITDQNGKFEIKGVRAKNDDELRVEAKFFSPAGDALNTFKLVKAVVPTTDAGTLQFPALPALSILIRPMEAKTKPGVAIDMGVVLSRKLSAPATINLTNEEGVKLEITPATLTIQAGQTEAAFKVKGDLPGKGTVVAKLAATVDDATPDNSRKGAALVYVINPAPVLGGIRPVSGAPGSTFTLAGTGLSTDAQQNTVFFKQGDKIAVVDAKSLKVVPGVEADGSVTLAGIVPGLRAGDVEVYAGVLRNGVPSELSNKVKFTVTQTAAPKLDAITPTSGAPGATFTVTGFGLDANPKNLGIFFKLGDAIIPSPVELLKVLVPPTDDPTKPATIQGIVPRMAAGDAEVFAVVYRNGAPSEPSNKLAFKVLTPPGAKLDSVNPVEGTPGTIFTIKGSNFDADAKRNFVFFKQGDRLIQLDPATLKFDGQTMISGVVPRIAPGGYEIFVVTNLESVAATVGKLPGTASNGLPFKVPPPSGAKLDSIDPVEGPGAGYFTLKGSGWGLDVKTFRVVFKQGDRFIMVEPVNIKFDATMIAGRLPNLAAGDYEVFVVTNLDLVPAVNTATPPGTPSNSLKFKMLPPPAPVLETITPTEGAPGMPFRLTGKGFIDGQVIYFKQGDKQIVIQPTALKITATTIEGVLPFLPPGGAEVGILIGLNQPSSTLPFKFLAPAGAKLESIAPTEGLPRTAFAIKGTGFDPVAGRNLIIFKQGTVLKQLDVTTVKLEGGVLSGLVPEVVAGDYDVIVMTNIWMGPLTAGAPAGVPSNWLKFKVLAPPPPPVPTLEAITPAEGAPGAYFKLTGKNFPAALRVVFKQGDIVRELSADLLKITATTIDGVLPGIPPGTAEVIVLFGVDGKTNSLPFKFLAPANAARLDAVNPTQVTLGGAFKLTGVNLAPFYDVLFTQGTATFSVPRAVLKFAVDGSSIEGVVPGLTPGDAQVFVGYGTAIANVVSNKLPVIVPAPSAMPEAITVDGKAEGAPGNTFKLTGKNLSSTYSIVFKQGDKSVVLTPNNYQIVDGVMVGIVPDLPAGATQVFLTSGPGTASSVILNFFIKSRV